MKDFNLTVSIESYFGPSSRLEVQGQRATAFKSADGKSFVKEERELEAATLCKLKSCLDDIGVFDWEPHYLDCCMLDGISWSVVIQSQELRLKSRGTNGYPHNWPDFIRILNELLGLGESFLKHHNFTG